MDIESKEDWPAALEELDSIRAKEQWAAVAVIVGFADLFVTGFGIASEAINDGNPELMMGLLLVSTVATMVAVIDKSIQYLRENGLRNQVKDVFNDRLDNHTEKLQEIIKEVPENVLGQAREVLLEMEGDAEALVPWFSLENEVAVEVKKVLGQFVDEGEQ